MSFPAAADTNGSLARRSRTRTRSKTLSSSPRPDFAALRGPLSAQLYGERLVAEPAELLPDEYEELGERTVMPTAQGFSSAAPDIVSKQSKAATQASTLPGIATQIDPPPSAFSRVPSIPQLYDLGSRVRDPGNQARDSVWTQVSGFTQSGATTSLYPPSTSTTSGTESPPSPRSIAEQDVDYDVSSFDPDVDSQEYEGDDVSYRLRLLVKNSYFLPPAHSKPSSSDFAATVTAKKASRPPTTPTFFDMFRKSRSKPSTPTGGVQTFDLLTPVLRTTSDSTTVSGYGPPRPRRSSSQTAQPPHPGAAHDPSGRVVVVREKMHDIASAARQAEQEMQSRVARREESFGQRREVDIIDPTDAVDLPPPSASYPFAVQAAALHGMGVLDSVGAAQLADRLPPRSPGAVSVEDGWRKALLHAAVHHSLNNSVSSSPIAEVVKPRTPTVERQALGQRIITTPQSSVSLDQPRSPVHSPRQSSHQESEEVSGRPSDIPIRVVTPSMPLFPLMPPPRRVVNPIYSISQTSLPIEPVSESVPRSLSSMQIRKTTSTPRLSDSYESGVRHTMMSPPLISREDVNGEQLDADTDSSASFYSDEQEEEDIPRYSVSSSVPHEPLSMDSQPSPTTSAFQDALSHVVSPPIRGSSLRQSLDQHSLSTSPTPRHSTVSPPPRVSSSLAHITPLPPPPRTSSLSQLSQRLPRIAIPSEPSPSVPVLSPVPGSPILDPGPSTPPLPVFERRGLPLALEIPGPDTYYRSMRSAPAPSSPPSFFDSIQNQPNAMDDLDSSSDEDSDEGEPEPPHTPPRTPIFVDPRTRAVSNVPSGNSSSRSLLMRLGNHSTPYVSPSNHTHSDPERKRPIGNIPVANSFFTERRSGKSDQGHGPPVSTFDFYQYTQQHPLSSVAESSRRPQTGDGKGTRPRQTSHRAQESLKRLDGLFLQHMEAEKNTIKRIATNIQSNGRN
ncbi:hypothetical protein C8J57DRAFT_1289883 [Mycena rebaudengoi]|nr:hypothetical protein C8J57DRAFT_1289883 [Mycena rebaudengoi]